MSSRSCANWPAAVRNCCGSGTQATTSARSARCSTCRVRRRCGPAPMRRSSATRWRRSVSGSASVGFATSSSIARCTWMTWMTRPLRRNKAEQQVGPDRLDAVEPPALCVRDGQHADIVDRGDRAAQQDRRDIGQDPVDRTRPQKRARQRRAALDENVRAVGQRLDHFMRVAGPDHHRPRVVVEHVCLRGDLALPHHDTQRLPVGEAAVGQPCGQLGVVDENRSGADDDGIGGAAAAVHVGAGGLAGDRLAAAVGDISNEFFGFS